MQTSCYLETLALKYLLCEEEKKAADKPWGLSPKDKENDSYITAEKRLLSKWHFTPGVFFPPFPVLGLNLKQCIYLFVATCVQAVHFPIICANTNAHLFDSHGQ